MGIHITDDTNVALYDSVTGIAFGPTFTGDEEAQAFLTWTEEQGLDDPRSWSPEFMSAKHSEWYDATHDADGDWIGDDVTDDDDLGDDFGDDALDD